MATASFYKEGSSRYGYALSILLLIFSGRVIAQLVQVVYPLSVLPPFQAWHSGILPYGLLLLFQLTIIALCVYAIRTIFSSMIMPSRLLGYIMLGIGTVYLGAMCIRLIVGLTIVSNHFWWGARLPTIFHVILATFVLVYGHFHYTYGEYHRSHIRTDSA